MIIQDDGFSETLSIAVCLLTSEPLEAPMLRIFVEPSPENGLRAASRLMVEHAPFSRTVFREFLLH